MANIANLAIKAVLNKKAIEVEIKNPKLIGY